MFSYLLTTRFAIIAPTCGPSSYARTQPTHITHVPTNLPCTPTCSPHLDPTHTHTQPTRVLAHQSAPLRIRTLLTRPRSISLPSPIRTPSPQGLPQPHARSPARKQLMLDPRPRTYTRA
ncbi:hypothetical protein FIBSPDRAFT_323406 [Athelia psychrophila]|uniref:Uncharacterized protein n=1 Tax=Athelia psychrophila TaxID=1759441 RepID=A0A167WQF8_9AGAM|nr:hypothetical protein FIBSPDRAFT_323406 [Fibularhizoctonia sp. CBS 109695]